MPYSTLSSVASPVGAKESELPLTAKKFTQPSNLSAQTINGGALGLQLLAFWNNTSMWLHKWLRASPLTWAA